uniref:Plectin n=1 Tax=Meleagris gallopavo TaxID=9103 RepID=A0A803YNC0_MELGA
MRHRAAYKRGYLDKKMTVILSDPSDDTKGFFDPNTEENLTYLQLKEKCVTEPGSGLCLLPLNSGSSWLPVRFGLEQIRAMLEEEMKKWAPIKFPALRGSVSAYHLMETGIIDRTLLEEVLEGSVSPEEVLRMDSVRKYLYGSGSIGGIVLQPSNQRMSIYEAMKQNIVVPGVALPLLEAQAATGFIIDPVNNQKLRVDEAVKEGVIGPEVHEKLQQAEGAVSGYKDPFTEESKKKMSFYDAMKNNLLLPGAALKLLEAQAATGFLTDPATSRRLSVRDAVRAGVVGEELTETLLRAERAVVGYTDPYTGSPISLCQAKNKKFSVEEALKAGLVGVEVYEKLLSAERAVTGYVDPYTKAPMSLFEAMNQGLIVKSHGVRLLEAQIATGGIIDPVHSHRIPVEVAYKRGLFDEEMNRVLSDPSDDTKGFFDPN